MTTRLGIAPDFWMEPTTTQCLSTINSLPQPMHRLELSTPIIMRPAIASPIPDSQDSGFPTRLLPCLFFGSPNAGLATERLYREVSSRDNVAK